jgi:hypothetical protein
MVKSRQATKKEEENNHFTISFTPGKRQNGSERIHGNLTNFQPDCNTRQLMSPPYTVAEMQATIILYSWTIAKFFSLLSFECYFR